MAIVQIGLPIEANTIRVEAGQGALELHRALERCTRFKTNCLDRIVDGDLTALGFTSGDVAILRSAYGDAAQLRSIANEGENLATAKDFFTFLGQLTGVR